MDQTTIRSTLANLEWTIFLVMTILSASCQTGNRTESPPPALEVEEVADQILMDYKKNYGIPGIATAVLRRGEVIYSRTIGLAHIELDVPLRTSFLFQLSSSSKLFTGILAMRLQEEGKLDLRVGLKSLLPEAPEGWEKISLQHCLSHTSGLPLLDQIPGAFEGEKEPEEILRDLYRLAPDPTPLEDFRYNQTGYFLVQQILEDTAGRPFEDLVREYVLDPAGMSSSEYWGSDDQVLKAAATQYYPNGRGGLAHRRFLFPPYLFSAAGLTASLEDLISFDRSLWAGKLLTPSSIDKLLEPQQLRSGEVSSYGLGWDLIEHSPGQKSAGHGGGYLTTYRRYRDKKLSVIMLTNGVAVVEDMDPDDLATTLAAVWEPEILGRDLGANGL